MSTATHTQAPPMVAHDSAPAPASSGLARPSDSRRLPRALRAAPGALQARLLVGPTDGPFERDAERLADLVTDGRAPAPPAGGEAPAAESGPPLRASAVEGATPAATPIVAAALGRAGPGSPLPSADRADFEERLGHDFAAVRVHADEPAAEAACGLRAHAFARGSDIYFARGAYRPHTHAGRHLIAHELAHVIQQRPQVIARQPVEAPAPQAPDASADPTSAAAAEIADMLRADPSDAAGEARGRLNALEPASRTAVIARVRLMLGPRQRAGLAALLSEPGARPGARAPSQPSPPTPPEPAPRHGGAPASPASAPQEIGRAHV